MAAGILLLGLASCVKEPLPEDDPWAPLCGDKPVRFISTAAETKAASELTDGSTFGVFAFLQEGDVENGTVAHWNSSRQPNFMFNQLVEKDAGVYSYSPLRHWPSNEENTVSFWAYSPHNPSAVLYESGTTNAYTATSTGLPDVAFTVTDGRNDFMTSDLVKDQTRTSNTSNPGVVPLEFHHRLAWVEFKAKTAGNYQDPSLETPITITVTSVQIINDYTTAVFRQNVSDWRDRSSERTNANAVTAFNGNVQLEYANAKTCSDYPIMMLPQDMDHTAATGNKVTVVLKYNQKQGNFDVNKTATITLDQVAQFQTWEKNKRYIYTFTISANDAVNLTVQVQNWEYWLGTSNYTESVTITKQLTWDEETYEAGSGSNCTEEALFTVDGVESTYKVLVLKPGTNLRGSFIFDTPYQGKWYAMLESIEGSTDGSIVFTNNDILLEGSVGNECTIEIKPVGTASTAQYAVLRFMCRTVPVDPDDPSTAQTLYVNPANIGGQFIIKQNIN